MAGYVRILSGFHHRPWQLNPLTQRLLQLVPQLDFEAKNEPPCPDIRESSLCEAPKRDSKECLVDVWDFPDISTLANT